MTRQATVIAVFLFLICSLVARADSLSLDGYLGQVQNKHTGVQSAALVAEATGERTGESSLPLAWSLNAGVEQRNDFRRPIGVQFQNISTVYSLGISKMTSFGLSGKVGLTVQPLTFVNVNPTFASFLPFTSYFDVATTVELSQSLWRNGFGRSTRAQRDVDEAQARAGHFRSSYATRQILAQAETTYWQASSFQEALRIQKENLARAEKMVAWSKSKLALDLADKADLLQAQSSLRLRELDLAQATSDFRSACRQFNSLRGIDSDELSETLASVYVENIDALSAPARAEVREDVAAAIEDSKVAYGNARLGAERNKPSLDAYVSYSVTGRDGTLSGAMGFMGQATYPLGVVGVRFATPLHFGLISDNNEAYIKEQKAADLNQARKQFEQENDWKELVHKLEEGKQKLRLARELEKAQSDKYAYERGRLKSAKTMLFQVLMFEQDYGLAQLNRLQKEVEVRGILTQMKLFGGKT